MTQGRTDVEWLLAQGAWMRSLARGLLGDSALAEDVVQESYAAALTRGPRALGPDRERLRPWLAAVVGNLARRARGREALRSAVEERGARAEATEPADDLVARMELQRALAEAVLALDEPYRSAVLLRHVENLGAREIARRQGCTSEVARQRVARGLERLRRTLDRRPGGRSAWAAVLTPLSAPAPLVPSATALGGMLMGSKLIALVLAGASLAVFAFVYGVARGPSEGAGARGSRELAPVRLALDARSAELVAPAAPAASARQALEDVQPAPAPLELAGLVHDSSGRPLAGANLVLAASESAAAAIVARAQPDARWSTSDALGAFHLCVAGAPEATRTLWASSADYLPARVEVSDSAPLDVLLRARPVLEIVLRGPGGSALDGPAHAQLWVRRGDGSVEELGVDPDERRRLIARGLPLGRVERIQARQRGAGRVERALELPLVPDGYERLELELPRGATVRGVVLDARTEQPVPGAQVWAEEGWLSEESASPVTRADGEGRFELVGVEPEPASGDPGAVWCLVSAGADGYVGQRFEAHAWQENEERSYWAELRLVPASARLQGRVLFPDAHGAPARVWAVDGRAQFFFRVTDGAFELEPLSPGKLELFLLTDENAPAEARAALRTSLELAEGETRQAEFALARADAVIRGRVLDLHDRPVRGARAGLSLNMYTERLAFGTEDREVTTDAAGRFEFRSTFPGRYHLKLLELPEGLVSEPFEDDLEMAAGETRALELRCGAPIELAGRVELGAEDPAALRVVAHAADDGAELADSVVAADGAFCFPRLYPTEIELRLMRDERELARTTAGPAAARELVLRAQN